jgi:Rrf2 family transcriptional regulator, nitric oxide-sensitive transcriptional repressor
MQLSLHADYSMRVLIYLATHPDKVVSTQEISTAYTISKNHLVRVVHTLARNRYVNVTLGRGGGIKLARAPRDIRLGDVVRAAEPDLKLVECFDRKTNTCRISASCALKHYLSSALEVFLAHLNQHTLADLVSDGNGAKLIRLFDRV